MRLSRHFVLLFLVVLTGACGRDPFALEWVAAPDTVLLYAISRPEVNLASGFDFRGRRTVRVGRPDAPDTWDMIVDVDGDQIVMIPPGALGIDSEAAIAELPGEDFDVINQAPEFDDERYIDDQPMALRIGVLYVIRTRRQFSTFGQRCNHYAKMVPVEVDIAERSLRFLYDTNQICNSRNLQPDIVN